MAACLCLNPGSLDFNHLGLTTVNRLPFETLLNQFDENRLTSTKLRYHSARQRRFVVGQVKYQPLSGQQSPLIQGFGLLSSSIGLGTCDNGFFETLELPYIYIYLQPRLDFTLLNQKYFEDTSNNGNPTSFDSKGGPRGPSNEWKRRRRLY